MSKTLNNKCWPFEGKKSFQLKFRAEMMKDCCQEAKIGIMIIRDGNFGDKNHCILGGKKGQKSGDFGSHFGIYPQLQLTIPHRCI